MPDPHRIQRLVETLRSTDDPDRSLYADIGLTAVALSVTWSAVGIPVAVVYVILEGLTGLGGAYELYGGVLLAAFEPPFLWAIAAGLPLLLSRVMPSERAFAIGFASITVIHGLGSQFTDPGYTLLVLLVVYLGVGLFARVLSKAEDLGTLGATDLAPSPKPEPATDGGQLEAENEADPE